MPRTNAHKLAILGAGRSGVSLALYLRRQGYAVVLSDEQPRQAIARAEELAAAGVELDLGGHDEAKLLQTDAVLVSPGIAPTCDVVKGLRRQGATLYGDVDWIAPHLQGILLAVTGTNGKSTTTVLLGRMLQQWGRQAFVGGNLGIPLAEALGQAWDYIVAELSSFQLEWSTSLHPRYVLLLNLTADHMDRHGSMEAYAAAKARALQHLGEDDVVVYNSADPRIVNMVRRCPARLVPFNRSQKLSRGMGCDGGLLQWRWQGQKADFPLSQLLLKGRHNIENVMAALVPALLEGCPPEVAWEAATGFGGLAHRMEVVARQGGITWIDDSKATNVGSMLQSLQSLQPPVTLIAGGRDKGADFTPVAGVVQRLVPHVILLGESKAHLARAWAGCALLWQADSMRAAVSLAASLTKPGGTVLLAPGCASFDMFASFEQRGEIFAHDVKQLLVSREQTDA